MSKQLLLAKEQPSLANLVVASDEKMLNENIIDATFDVDYPDEGWFRVGVAGYNPMLDRFDVNSVFLDIWENGDNWEWFDQEDLDLNQMFQNQQVKHVLNPIVLPHLEEIQAGKTFGENMVGRECELVVEQKHRTRYQQVEVVGFDTENGIHEVYLKNGHVRYQVNLNEALRSGKLRIENFSHVLRRLQAFVNTNQSPGIAARSMAPSGYG